MISDSTHMDLSEEFFEQEFNDYVRELICDAWEECLTKGRVREEFTFNRFNLVLDFAKKTAVIEDDLSMGLSGTVELPLEVFLSRVGYKGIAPNS